MGLCPLLPSCKEKVDLEKYREYCANITEDKYKECDIYKREVGVNRTPLEWSRLLSGVTVR